MNRVSIPEEAAIPPNQATEPTRLSATGARAGDLCVGVVVDLFWEPDAGGHVKCWERFAEAAIGEPGLDLTIYFLGQKGEVITLAPNVRYMTRRPLLDTNRIWFLDKMPDHTDLAPIHPRFIRHWRRLHVLHTTDAFFTLARTALLYARWSGKPLVNSIHTDTPRYTRLYSERAIGRLFGGGRVGKWFTTKLHVHERMGRAMQRKLDRYVKHCDWVLGSESDEMDDLRAHVPPGRFSALRRGVDKSTFHPAHRDRARLKQQFGIGEEQFVIVYAGRLDDAKNVLTLAQAARHVRDVHKDVHVIFAGEGAQREEIRALLNGGASLPGPVPQSELAWLYASSDLFVFPSRTEISPNVVVEAKASGLPIVVSGEGGAAQFIREHAEDGMIVEDHNPAQWAEAIRQLRGNREARQAMGARARRSIEAEWPSWADVLRQDLLPVWQRVAREKGQWG